MVVIIGIALTVLTLLFISYPLLQKTQRQVSFNLNHRAEDLQARKDEIYAAIRDIDFDYRMGKLSEEDHTALREQYKNEAIRVMKELDQLTLSPAKSRRKKSASPQPAEKFCHNCGNQIDPDDSFCSTCGARLK